MNKDEIIELLKEQNSHYKSLADSLLVQVKELTEEIASLKEALLRKDESLGKQQRIAKGLAKLVGNKSERQDVHPDVPADEEGRKRQEAGTSFGKFIVTFRFSDSVNFMGI